MRVWLLNNGLLYGRFACEIPGPYFGSSWALINLAVCNFACPYCITGGAAKDERNRFPSSEEVELSEVLAFVEHHVERGHPILVSGAEPLMVSDAIHEIAQTVRRRGGFVQLMTNGSMPAQLGRLLPLIDAVNVDVKAAGKSLPRVTGVDSTALTWDRPLQCVASAVDAGVVTWVTTPCFASTTLDELVEIGEALPDGIDRWHLMQFVPAELRDGRWSLEQEAYRKRGFEWPQQTRTLELVAALGHALPSLQSRLWSTSLDRDLVQLKAPWTSKASC